MNARVALVGAGPGDPGLLTRRALSLLRRADLVLYDALVPLAIVDEARRARRFYVGKRAGRHAMTQESIHRLMIRAAARGQLIQATRSSVRMCSVQRLPWMPITCLRWSGVTPGT